MRKYGTSSKANHFNKVESGLFNINCSLSIMLLLLLLLML